MAQILRTAGFTIFIALIAVVTAGATASATSPLSKAEVWFVYTRNDGGFVQSAHGLVDHTVDELPCAPTNLPSSWHIITALEADLTRDGAAECVLLVHRDMYGDSAHIILIDLQGQSEVWAGSALAVPIVEIAVGDVNGDGGAELVALEGDYTTGRNGPARNVAVWRWNGFGFTLAWRSSPGRFSELSLIDVNDDGAQEILVR
jgi:hypothetical protein